MSSTLTVRFLAPIPKGNRVQVIRVKRWASPLFGGASYWDELDDPILLDLDTGIVYCEESLGRDITLEPLGFKPQSGYQIASQSEAHVSACLVGSCGGDRARLRTVLVLKPSPVGYRS